jgi:DNA/RNA endonuclease G (NUC1)
MAEIASPGYPSFKALQEQHQRLLPQPGAEDQSIGGLTTATIKEFLEAAAATGRVIIEPHERRKAQGILRFWTAELITRGEGDWALPALAAPELDGASLSSSASAKRSEEDEDRDLARSRALVRIAASARQWRASDKDRGWLLKGDALSEAEQFAGDDDDIRALVAASRLDETQYSRRKIGVLTAMVLALLVFAGVTTWLLYQRSQALADATHTLEDNRDLTSRLMESNTQLQESLTEQARQTRERQRQLDEREAALSEVAKLLHRLREEGHIDAASIPAILQPLVTALDQAPQAAPVTVDRLMRGYDENFLQTTLVRAKSQAGGTGAITIPMPRLVGASSETAYDGGRPLASINFSIVLDAIRRMPVISAVNLQRSRIVPLVRARDQFRLDPRVPPDLQIAPALFRGTGLDRGDLVSARDIAWGEGFPDDPEEAGRIAFGATTVMTNVTPQYASFNRGLWAAAERYAREQFSATSDRVVIFSGPVLAADDPMVASITVPQRFWKVLVASDPDSPGSLVVEAYVMPQADGGPTMSQFQPERYRARVSAIERLARLDFGQAVRAADIASQSAQLANPTTEAGRDLTAALRQATGADAAARRAAVQQLLDAVRAPGAADSDLRPLVEAIVAAVKSFDTLSPEARVNILTLLAAVPKARWDADRWIEIKAAARRAVADAAQTMGGCTDKSQSCAVIAGLKSSLDWSAAAGRVVLVQFAGMTREDVKAIESKLKLLDWSIPGEERTASAIGYNEVRYPGNDDDRRAAELLAADLRALGRSSVKAVKISGPAKTLEIWLSI